MDPEMYIYYSVNDKRNGIKKDSIDGMYFCPVCGESYCDLDDAVECCHQDCYEQDSEFSIEEQADFRMRQAWGD